MAQCPGCGAEVGAENTVCPDLRGGLSEPTASFRAGRSRRHRRRPAAPAAEGPVLVVRKGPQPGERFFVDRGTLSIGRDPESDIFLNDITVSRAHAVIECDDERGVCQGRGFAQRHVRQRQLVESARLGQRRRRSDRHVSDALPLRPGSAVMSSRDYLTIGEVVQRLQGAYPDLSISKVRFLEEEGLVAPERTAGGYRKFSQADVARVEMILRLQKEHFLPLAVIREKLADFDRGKIPAELQRGAVGMTEPLPLAAEDEGPLLLE